MRIHQLRRPLPGLVLLVALAPLALDGCVSVGVERTAPPAEAAVPAGTTLTWCWPNESAIGLVGTPYAALVSFVWPSTTTSGTPPRCTTTPSWSTVSASCTACRSPASPRG